MKENEEMEVKERVLAVGSPDYNSTADQRRRTEQGSEKQQTRDVFRDQNNTKLT